MSLDLILEDAITIKELYHNIKGKDYESIFFMGIIPYTAIWIDSTLSFINDIDDNIDIPKEEYDLVREIRSKIKMYNEKIKKNIDKTNSIHDFHNNFFEGLCKYKFLKILGLYDNFGTYLLDDKYIGNTYLYHWYYGCNKNKEIDNLDLIKEKSFTVGKTLGSTLRYIGILNYNKNNINLLSNKLKVTDKDYNLSRNKHKLFNNNYNKDTTLIMFNILCSVNFVVYFLDKVFPKDNYLYFRIKYNCYYYSIYSLDKIINYSKVNCKINTNIAILEKEINKLKVRQNIIGSKFRNCMAHYKVTSEELKEEEIIINVPMYGLVEKYFEQDYNSLNNKIYDNLVDLSNILENFIIFNDKESI